jgi:hypothetical protein
MLDVPVDHGEWHARVPKGSLIVFIALTADDRPALLSELNLIQPNPEPIVVRGQWLKHGSLRVIDAETKQELSDVEVRCASGWRAIPEWTHPGDDERIKTVVDHATSPIDLPDRTWLTPYWVHAPHHAWCNVTFDHKVGGQRTVELSPNPSAVTIAIDGDLPKDAFVRLYSTEATRTQAVGGRVVSFFLSEEERVQSWMAIVSTRASATGPTTIDDLQAGKFLATIEVGQGEDKLRIGSAPVELRAGETARVDVPIDASLLDVPRTHLFGTIRVSNDLERAKCSLILKRMDRGEVDFQQRLSQMPSADDDPNTLQWDAGSKRTGDYLAYFTIIQHRELVHASGPGDTKVELTIPPLATVTVDVVDAATGATLEPDHVQWSDGKIERVSMNMLLPVRRNPVSQKLDFIAPFGTVEVSCSKTGYQDASRTLALSASKETCRFELVRATTIRVLLREGDAAASPGFEVLGQITIRREGSRIPTGTPGRSTESAIVRFVDEPGRYEVELPALSGFEPIQPRTVDVAAGQTAEVVVQLKRKP